MTSRAELARQVEERAGQRCEYCRMHQSLQGARFHVEHVVPSADGGSDELDNLALACMSCNLKKSARSTWLDPETLDMVPGFNPRAHRWEDHFAWDGLRVVGRTANGRAMIRALELNHPRRLRIRQAEGYFALFPP